ncbi:heat shock transcription factor, X-linked member 3 [Manis pentadactyla]|uniref:heat shock transcription factor, X-linked member 3 n=1 Tax=Manis pentadactyla TaxID=143292 RepID=UPI00255C81AF|nr:heat shock transcription factor, X-linked member 3 [Manis pentadactyla]
MASQGTDEVHKAKPALVGDGEPDTGVPRFMPGSTFGFQGHCGAARRPSRRPTPRHHQHGRQDIKDILRLPLPRKLWLIVQDDAFTSVHWNDHGDAVINKQDLFQREIPHRSGSDRIFETDSLTTSIRQMNLCGFSKIRPDDPCACSPGNKRMMRDKPLLVENMVQRRGYLRSATQAGRCAAAPEKPVATVRSCLCVCGRESARAACAEAQHKGPSAQGPGTSHSPTFPGAWSMHTAARCPTHSCSPREPQGPSWESMSRNGMCAPGHCWKQQRRGAAQQPPS